MAGLVIGVLLVLCILPSTGDKPSVNWETAYRAAQAQLDDGHFENARQSAAPAFAQCRLETRSRWHWPFRLLLAESLLELGRLDEAEPLLAADRAPPEFEARRLAGVAQLRFGQRSFDRAEQSLRRAEALPHTPEITARIELMRGMMHVKNLEFAAAEEGFKRALGAAGKPRSLLACYALINLGYLYMVQFRYDEAVRWLERAQDIARQTGAQRAEAIAVGNLGVVYLWLGDPERSIKLFNEAADIGEKLGDVVFEQRWLVLTGEAYESMGSFSTADVYYRRARQLPDPDAIWLNNILADLTEMALERGDIAGAEKLNAQALTAARGLKTKDALLLPSLNAGRIATARKHAAEAEAYFQTAIALSRAANDPISQWQSHSALAASYRASNRVPEAGREYRAAIDVIESERSRIGKDELRLTFLSHLIRFYQDYVDFLFERGQTRQAFEAATSSRARVLAEKVRQPESDRDGDLHRLERLFEDRHAVLMSYWLAPARSFLWVVDSSGLHAFALPGKPEIEARVKRWDDSIKRDENPLETESEAGRWLFANLVAEHYTPPPGSHIVIVPDGMLHELNFETLPGPSGDYWIRDVTVAVSPSPALLRAAEKASPGRLFLIGNPDFQSDEFPRLRHVKAEMDAVSSRFAERDVFEASAATPEAYRQARLPEYSTLHFAAHAIAAREPLDSAIILSGGRDNHKLYARDIIARPLRAELVTLSACQTAGNRTYSGEGLTGLAWAFLSAGARNVVAGLWDVDDRATAQMMPRFYDSLAAGQSPAVALRSAKLALMESSNIYRKPIYWGAFETFTRAPDPNGAPGLRGPSPLRAAVARR